MKLLTLFITLLVTYSVLNAQSEDVIPFDSERWAFTSQDYALVDDYQNKRCISFQGGFTLAYLKDADFKNGIIEFDVAFQEKRTFLGVAFRMQDLENYEDFYLRPHQSGNPDANQYNPVYNFQSAWQTYHGKDFAQPTVYKFGEWMHVKCLISGSRAEFYIEDMDNPAVYIPFLKRDTASGMVGVWGGEAYFANFKYMEADTVQLKNPVVEQPMEPGVIAQWQVSNAFEEDRLQKATTLPEALSKELSWQTLSAENLGIVNLSQLSKVTKKNTVLSQVILRADKAKVVGLGLGFSDRTKVYLNNQLVYAGDNTFQSRDYRFLGSIGLFDELYLPLQKGENTLTIAVSETFGGWAIITKLMSEEGIEVVYQ